MVSLSSKGAGTMYVTIKEPTQGLIVWQGKYQTVEEAIKAYRADLGSEASDYDSVDPDWIEQLFICTER
jgi:hypothetical protein